MATVSISGRLREAPPAAVFPHEPTSFRNMSNCPPLHQAVLAEDEAAIRSCLQNNPQSIHERDSYGNFPIAYAKKIPIIELLLLAGAKIFSTTLSFNPENQAFLQAVKENDILAVKDLIEKGRGDVHAKFVNDNEVLHVAAEKENPLMLLLLIRAGANIEAKNRGGGTPLKVAAGGGKDQAVSILLRQGARPDNPTHIGSTALHGAVFFRHATVVRLLIDASANLDAEQNDGETPLTLAFSVNQPFSLEIARMLIEAGVNLKKPNKKGQMALHCAAQYGLDDLILDLINKRGLSVELADKFGGTSFHYAASQNQLNTMRLLLAKGAKHTATSQRGKNALHCAAHGAKADSIEFLLSLGLDPHELTKDGLTPLHFAAEAGNTDAIACFVQNKVPIDARDKKMMTPLHLAASSGREAAVNLLIELGADKEALDGVRHTPLHLAAEKFHLTTVHALLRHNANPNARNMYDQTPLHRGIVDPKGKAEGKNIQMARALLRAGADINAQASFAVTNTYGTVKQDVKVSGKTSLHVAASLRDIELIRYLLSQGANARIRDSDGKFAEHYEGASMALFHAAHIQDPCPMCNIL